MSRGDRHTRAAGKGRRVALAMAGAVLLTALGACSAQTGPAVRPGHGFDVVVASWYGDQYHGRQTASGEVYDMYDLTAAHKTLPFGTRLRVTHPRTGRSVVVKVNDRGPFVRGRELDLSYGAADALGMVAEGVARVRIQRLN
ncbi:MAG: septal ring lytic transglycosylase RlpA family protein [Acidobacteriota bacterium]